MGHKTYVQAMHSLQNSLHALNSWVCTQARQPLAALTDPLGTRRKQVDELPLRFQSFEIRLDLGASSSSLRCGLNPSTGELSNVTLIAHHQLQLAPLMLRSEELSLSDVMYCRTISAHTPTHSTVTHLHFTWLFLLLVNCNQDAGGFGCFCFFSFLGCGSGFLASSGWLGRGGGKPG